MPDKNHTKRMSRRNAPLIAVTGPDKPYRFGWWATRFMLWLCGCRSIHLTARYPNFTRAIDGIVIGGGDDIDPVHYGLLADPERRYDRERDHFEKKMIELALAAKIPILGICRGAQLLNVVLRGNLHTSVRTMRSVTSNRNYIRPVKWVTLVPTSNLQHALDCERIKVNSLHSQAVNELGEGLVVAGRDGDGIIQAVEGAEPFKLGVQWHPEYLPYKKAQRTLFRYFVQQVITAQCQLQPVGFSPRRAEPNG